VTVAEHLLVFRERWITLTAGLLVGMIAGCVTFYLQPPTYTANIQMYVASAPTDNTSSFLSSAQFAQNRVKSYTALATSSRVMRTVIQQLRLEETVEELQGSVGASNTTDSVVINLTVTDRSAERSAAIANAIGATLRDVVNEIEQPPVAGRATPVVVRAIEPADVPTAPSSTSLKRLLGIGALVGLAAGVGAALARNAVDNTVKDLDQLRVASGAPNLGRIAFASDFAKRPLVVHEDPNSPRAEEFRQLRTNVQFVDVGNPHKVLVVTSAVSGEGKTTTAVNLAIVLSSAGNRVLLIDGDLRRPAVADLLGLEGLDGTLGVTSVLARRATLRQAIQPWNDGLMDVLPAGPAPPNPSELLASHHMNGLLRELRQQYDVILIDTPPLLPFTDAAAVAPFTDGAILVCRHRQTTRTQVAAAAAALRAVEAPLRGSVLTKAARAGSEPKPHGGYYFPSEGPSTGADELRMPVPPTTSPTISPTVQIPRVNHRPRVNGTNPSPRPRGPQQETPR
jgi:polysaccharide biosynthesis transport protein